MKNIYYAHSMHIYCTPQELRDLDLLKELGFEVVNPNSKEVQGGIEEYKKANPNENYMMYFNSLIDQCDALAYRCHVDMKIPSGVLFEIDYATRRGKPIIELPTIVSSRRMSVEETREYLKYNGQR